MKKVWITSIIITLLGIPFLRATCWKETFAFCVRKNDTVETGPILVCGASNGFLWEYFSDQNVLHTLCVAAPPAYAQGQKECLEVPQDIPILTTQVHYDCIDNIIVVLNQVPNVVGETVRCYNAQLYGGPCD